MILTQNIVWSGICRRGSERCTKVSPVVGVCVSVHHDYFFLLLDLPCITNGSVINDAY